MTTKKSTSHIKKRTYFSIFSIILSLLTLVFLQMEERRLGYSILVLNKEYRKLTEIRYRKDYQYQLLTRPQYVEKMATVRKELKKVRPEQVIHMSGVSP